MNISEMFEHIRHGSKEHVEETREIFCEFIDSVKRQLPVTYNKYSQKIEKTYNRHDDLTELEAIEAVSKLKNKDGSVGPHWSVEQVEKTICTYPELKECHFWTLYYVLNMIYSDYYEPTYTFKTYVLLAKDFIDDEDAPEDKVRRYIEAMKKY